MANPKKPKKQDLDKLPGATKQAAPKEESNFEHPVEKAYSMVRRGSGWSVLTAKIQGDKVVEKTYTEPDAKNVTQERFFVLFSKEIIGA